MADISELKVQLTLTIKEIQQLVALINLAGEGLPETERPEIIDEVSGIYFELMANLEDGLGVPE